MSLTWTFYSFSWERWAAIFGGGMPEAERHVVESATWDEEAWDDVAVRERVARKIVQEGFSYDGLSEKECRALDSMTVGFFCSEGLEKLLGFEYESDEGIHPSLIRELVDRAGPSPKPGFLKRLFGKSGPAPQERTMQLAVLPALVSGRRLNGDGAPGEAYETYCILAPDEVSLLRQEVEGLLALLRPWADPAAESVVRDDFLSVLRTIESKGACLAARCC